MDPTGTIHVRRVQTGARRAARRRSSARARRSRRASSTRTITSATSKTSRTPTPASVTRRATIGGSARRGHTKLTYLERRDREPDQLGRAALRPRRRDLDRRVPAVRAGLAPQPRHRQRRRQPRPQPGRGRHDPARRQLPHRPDEHEQLRRHRRDRPRRSRVSCRTSRTHHPRASTPDASATSSCARAPRPTTTHGTRHVE